MERRCQATDDGSGGMQGGRVPYIGRASDGARRTCPGVPQKSGVEARRGEGQCRRLQGHHGAQRGAGEACG